MLNMVQVELGVDNVASIIKDCPLRKARFIREDYIQEDTGDFFFKWGTFWVENQIKKRDVFRSIDTNDSRLYILNDPIDAELDYLRIKGTSINQMHEIAIGVFGEHLRKAAPCWCVEIALQRVTNSIVVLAIELGEADIIFDVSTIDAEQLLDIIDVLDNYDPKADPDFERFKELPPALITLLERGSTR